MKVQELLKVLELTQKVKICDKNDLESPALYIGIVAGCFRECKELEIDKVKVEEKHLLVTVNYEQAKKEYSNDELLEMYFDESELGMDLGDLEKNLEDLIRGLDEPKFQFDFENAGQDTEDAAEKKPKFHLDLSDVKDWF